MQRLLRWASNDPIHAALTIGFGSAFAAYTLEFMQRANDQIAPPSALVSIAMLGLVAVSQASRCARLLVWLSTNQTNNPR